MTIPETLYLRFSSVAPLSEHCGTPHEIRRVAEVPWGWGEKGCEQGTLNIYAT